MSHTPNTRLSPFVVATLTPALLSGSALAQGGGGGGGAGDKLVWAIIAVVALVGFFVIIFLLQFLSLYVQALTSNAKVGLLDMVGMKLRKVDIRTVVINRIRAVKAGLEISTNALETHYLAGGRVSNVVSAMIAARGARIELPWPTATAIDLAGRDTPDAVHTSVNPRSSTAPPQQPPPHHRRRRQERHPVAGQGPRDGAPTSHASSAATEETIIARVGQGIVSTIGSAGDHKHVLENPDEISRKVMQTGLDAGTAYEILSIDIADIDVGENIGAKLDLDKANAQKQMAQAEAEKRRALAVAEEQEFRALEQKNRATVVLAEAEIPKAMAEAFRSGNFGVMDYYRMRNVQADTSMRSAIAGGDNPGDKPR